MRYMVGVDVGGTFTDITLVDTLKGIVENHKVSSTPRRSFVGNNERDYRDFDHE